MKAGYADGDRPLTPRMRDVLASAAAGRTAAQTAAELHVAETTVRSIRAALCARLEVANLPAAVLVAVRRGELH